MFPRLARASCFRDTVGGSAGCAGRGASRGTVALRAFFLRSCLPPNRSLATPAVRGVLHLNNGGTVSGDLAESLDPEMLRWQSPLFTCSVRLSREGDRCRLFRLAGDPAQAGRRILL